MDYTHVLTRDVTTPSGKLVPEGTRVCLRSSRKEIDGRWTYLLRLSNNWKTGGEFVCTYDPQLLRRIK